MNNELGRWRARRLRRTCLALGFLWGVIGGGCQNEATSPLPPVPPTLAPFFAPATSGPSVVSPEVLDPTSFPELFSVTPMGLEGAAATLKPLPLETPAVTVESPTPSSSTPTPLPGSISPVPSSTSPASVPAPTRTLFPTPNLTPPTGSPTARSGPTAAATSSPTPTPRSTLLPTRPATGTPALVYWEIYSESLASGWSYMESSMVTVSTGVRDYVHGGTRAISFGPWRDYGTFLLTVQPGSPVEYRRDQILGIRFWISAGTNSLESDDLAVTILGSNDYPYYVSGDRSVPPLIEGEPTFSETRFYDLGLNRTVLPGEWVELIVWLDDLQFDPDYTYVTGIYLKNDVGVRGPFFIDDLDLIVNGP